MNERNIKISEISQIIGVDFVGDDIIINGLNLCNRKSIYDSILSYIEFENYTSFALNNQSIKALFVTQKIYEKIYNKNLTFFIIENPEETFYNLHHKLYEYYSFYSKYNFFAKIGIECNIHKSAIIEDGTIVGNHVSIGANSIIKKGTIIDDNVIIGCCSIIGSEGFQVLYNKKNIPYTVKHVGGTYIGKNVVINDNCTVCNSLFEGDVYIGDNCKIDSQVHIGHNCTLGKNTVVTGNSLLMGSVELKDNVWVAPSSTISNKCIVNKNTFIGSMSLVVNNIPENMKVFGIPAIPTDDYFKILIQQKKIIEHERKNIRNNQSDSIE